MSEPFVAEIRIVGFTFAPTGWAFCNGQLMAIAQNTALFSLLGTTYGGDGRTTFALPNLQGCAPLSAGQGPGLTNRILGEASGSPTVSLLASELPAHTHQIMAFTGAGSLPSPAGNVWGSLLGRTPPPVYAASSNTTMNAQALGTAGGGSGHNNMSPYLALNFIIALQGVFPARQ